MPISSEGTAGCVRTEFRENVFGTMDVATGEHESFIQQFLSPKVMRDLRLFGILDDDQQDEIEVRAIHDFGGYRHVRELLASQYNLGDREPNIQVALWCSVWHLILPQLNSSGLWGWSSGMGSPANPALRPAL